MWDSSVDRVAREESEHRGLGNYKVCMQREENLNEDGGVPNHDEAHPHCTPSVNRVSPGSQALPMENTRARVRARAGKKTSGGGHP